MYRSTSAARGARHHPVSVASHRYKPENCKNTPYLNSRHCHQLTDMKATHRSRIAMDQGILGELLGLSRPSANAALRELELAKLVKKVRNGVYQINPMLAGYDSPEDALDAVRAMPKADRLDSKTYVTDYHQAVAAYQDQLAEQRKKRATAAAAKKTTAAKRRGTLHAVG